MKASFKYCYALVCVESRHGLLALSRLQLLSQTLSHSATEPARQSLSGILPQCIICSTPASTSSAIRIMTAVLDPHRQSVQKQHIETMHESLFTEQTILNFLNSIPGMEPESGEAVLLLDRFHSIANIARQSSSTILDATPVSRRTAHIIESFFSGMTYDESVLQ
jgi:ERCC4-type nuclease